MVKNYHCGDLLSPALQSLIEKKLTRIERYGLEGVFDIYMKHEGKEEYELKIQLTSGDLNLLAKSTSKDMYKNIDDCVDKLNTQVVAKK